MVTGTAIVDTLGPAGHHIAQSSDLHRLLSSFHKDRPKSSRNLVEPFCCSLNELTKAPFEPMKDTDPKHLTLKTAFLLALASGKCRSEFHAWVANKVSNLFPVCLQWLIFSHQLHLAVMSCLGTDTERSRLWIFCIFA